MPLTKSEFDRWKAQMDQATEAMVKRPKSHVASIGMDGMLYVEVRCLSTDCTRALYEMLRAWYGEATMTEKARAVIEALLNLPIGTFMPSKLSAALDAYRAEQKQ